MSVRVCVGESYAAISHWGEIAAVSSIVPIYRNIFIISPRTCVEVPRIDWAGQRRKRERDPIKFGLAEQKERLDIGWRGGNNREDLSLRYLPSNRRQRCRSQRPLLRLHKRGVYSSCDAHFHLDCVNRCVSLRSLNLHTRAPIIIIIISFPNC